MSSVQGSTIAGNLSSDAIFACTLGDDELGLNLVGNIDGMSIEEICEAVKKRFSTETTFSFDIMMSLIKTVISRHSDAGSVPNEHLYAVMNACAASSNV